MLRMLTVFSVIPHIIAAHVYLVVPDEQQKILDSSSITNRIESGEETLKVPAGNVSPSPAEVHSANSDEITGDVAEHEVVLPSLLVLALRDARRELDSQNVEVWSYCSSVTDL